MRKIDRLRHEALQSCNARGHKMKRFYFPVSTVGYSACKECGAWVQILTHPAPNHIEIGGPAVAINCGDKP